LLAHFFPSRKFFIYEALVIGALAVHQIYTDVANGKTWYLLFVIVWISIFSGAMQSYKRFETMKPEDPPAPPEIQPES
jgi:hypothetical protein